MRKVSRADETYETNFRTASTEEIVHKTASVRTAEAWPSKIDHAHHIKEMNTLLDHHDKGEQWHANRGEMEQSRLHAAAADSLREATGHEGVPGEGIHPDYEGIDICMKCPGHTTWPCKVVNDYLNRR